MYNWWRRADKLVVAIWVVGIYVGLWLLSGGITALACGLTGGAWVHHGNPLFENNWFGSGSRSFCVKHSYYDIINNVLYVP